MKNTIIAMWSGPRNLSTAMMRSFENRDDTVVIDEPFYAHYLHKTGIDHPGKDLVIKSQSTDWDEVIDICLCANKSVNMPIFYQKHMAQHNLEGSDISWIKDVKNCLLIRDPKYVIASYNKQFALNDEKLLGYLQQKKIMDYLNEINGEAPIIVDASDIVKNPKNMLKKLCFNLGIDFSKKMLDWPKGGRSSDGVWAPYWYKQVEETTTFIPFKKKDIQLKDNLLSIYNNCLDVYLEMYDKRLEP